MDNWPDPEAHMSRSLRSLPYRLLGKFPLPFTLHWLAARAVNDRFLVGVMGVIRDDRERVLLCHHTYKRRPWGLPGGWMVRGESPLEALEREVREETGLTVRAGQVLLVGTLRDRPKIEFVVAADMVGGTFRPSVEVTAVRWWPLSQLPDSERVPAILAQVADLAPGEVGHYVSSWIEERQADR